jgi:hypothetical protein
MKRLVATTLLAVTFVSAVAAKTSERPPLFEVYEPQIESPTKASIGGQPLLIVTTIRAAKLAVDNKGVMVCLRSDDSKRFAALTRSHLGRYLVLKATDETMEVLHIVGPIDDGCLIFHYPAEEGMASYFRQRLKLRP